MPFQTKVLCKSHLLTINLADYFQVGTLKKIIGSNHWHRFENRLNANTLRTLNLLEQFQASATFFCPGWIAERFPEILSVVAAKGHQIACMGYDARGIDEMSPEEFRKDVVRSRKALETATGKEVKGHRIGRGWFAPRDFWALKILAEEGFSYDSSLRPIFWRLRKELDLRFPHLHRYGNLEIFELPLSSFSFGGFTFPISGGNYFRQFPQFIMNRAVSSWMKNLHSPFLMYFHVWELDPDQPRVLAAPWVQRVRQYRNLHLMAEILEYYLEQYRFESIEAYLGHEGLLSIPTESMSQRECQDIDSSINEAVAATRIKRDSSVLLRPVSIIVPCYNEQDTLPYLANTLADVQDYLSDQYAIQYVLVDDGSRDETWESMNRLLGGWKNCHLIHCPENRGVASAIMTGLRAAETDVVCSIDCDCSYDPHQLKEMIPLLKNEVDMVTASPYHPEGRVKNVPSWRLFFSKGLSFIYRHILRQNLHTFTSCFRVYRRESLLDIDIRYGGFLGVAEMIVVLAQKGAKVVEFPAVLEVRILGRSKLKTLRTIFGHLKLLGRILRMQKHSVSHLEHRTRGSNRLPDSDFPRKPDCLSLTNYAPAEPASFSPDGNDCTNGDGKIEAGQIVRVIGEPGDGRAATPESFRSAVPDKKPSDKFFKE